MRIIMLHPNGRARVLAEFNTRSHALNYARQMAQSAVDQNAHIILEQRDGTRELLPTGPMAHPSSS